MAEEQRLICPSEALSESGKGFRFTVARFGAEVPAFVVRYHGKVYGYLNQCGHVPAELDWQPGDFFDDSKLYLSCSIHGALYAPDSGRCLGGRCHGVGLKPLKICEIDDKIFLNL